MWKPLKIFSPYVKNLLIFSEKSNYLNLKIFSPYVKNLLTLREKSSHLYQFFPIIIMQLKRAKFLSF
ncbi:hypothetical protein X709_21895 [Salmonella enterica subsp. enterica serovar Virchow]|nr:hypothetical protein [Salmonella enterica subsp. enterica serovar Virchow]